MRKKKATQEDKTVKPKKKLFTKVPKQHDEGYVLKKNLGMKILRIMLWIILIFIFVRGIVSIFNSDKEDELKRLIADFKMEYNDFSNQNNEVMAFAQNFAKEYLTYEAKMEADYRSRLKPYVTTAFLNSTLNDFKNSATAIYVQAYRLEEYSDNQVDVYVLAEVEYYTTKVNEATQEKLVETECTQLVLCVPVYIARNSSYVVENIPLPVNDTVYLEAYEIEEYYGTSLQNTTALQTSVENFLKAYFEQDESVINYYLDTSADKSRFVGLKGRFTYLELESLKCYQEPGEDIICLVEFRIQDADNAAKLLQKINLSIREAGGKFYIKSMGTRTGNLKIK